VAVVARKFIHDRHADLYLGSSEVTILVSVDIRALISRLAIRPHLFRGHVSPVIPLLSLFRKKTKYVRFFDSNLIVTEIEFLLNLLPKIWQLRKYLQSSYSHCIVLIDIPKLPEAVDRDQDTMSNDTEPAFTPDSSNKEQPADEENTAHPYFFGLRERERKALIASYLLYTPKCIAIVMLVSLVWTVISALTKNTTFREYAVGWPGEPNFTSEFGINEVSGFYGPGSWAAWMLTFASCFLARIFVDEKQTGEKWAHLLTLDINLVSAYAYPLVAAVDVLLHTRTKYWLGEEVSTRYFVLCRQALQYCELVLYLGGFCQSFWV
jgi:hypothetical protein